MAMAIRLNVPSPTGCTCSACYNSNSTNTFGKDYDGVISEYALDGGGDVLGIAELAHTVNTYAVQWIPTVFLALGTHPGATTDTVQCYH